MIYTDNKGYKAVNYTEFIPLLINSNQEQQQQIKQQEERLNKQQSQINLLIEEIEKLKNK